MALVDTFYGRITLGDSRGKETTVRFRVDPTEAGLYFNEITQILKDGTALGLFFLSIEDLSAGTMRGKGVELITVDDTITFPAPDDNQYAFDKLLASYTAAGYSFNMSIPVRDDSVYLVASDGVTVRLDSPAAVTQFVSRFVAVVLNKYGDPAVSLDEIIVSS